MRLIDSGLNLLAMKLDKLARGVTLGPCRRIGFGPCAFTRDDVEDFSFR